MLCIRIQPVDMLIVVVGNTCMESPIVPAHFLNQGKQTTDDMDAVETVSFVSTCSFMVEIKSQ